MSYRYVKKAPKERQTEDTAGKTENFATRNVKLITFLVCIAIFLALFGPLSVFRIREMILEKRALEGQIPLETVVALSELDRDIYLSDLEKYTGERKENSYSAQYYMDIGEEYLLLANAEKPSGKVVYLTLLHFKSGEEIDVLTGDVRAFLKNK